MARNQINSMFIVKYVSYLWLFTHKMAEGLVQVYTKSAKWNLSATATTAYHTLYLTSNMELWFEEVLHRSPACKSWHTKKSHPNSCKPTDKIQTPLMKCLPSLFTVTSLSSSDTNVSYKNIKPNSLRNCKKYWNTDLTFETMNIVTKYF